MSLRLGCGLLAEVTVMMLVTVSCRRFLKGGHTLTGEVGGGVVAARYSRVGIDYDKETVGEGRNVYSYFVRHTEKLSIKD